MLNALASTWRSSSCSPRLDEVEVVRHGAHSLFLGIKVGFCYSVIWLLAQVIFSQELHDCSQWFHKVVLSSCANAISIVRFGKLQQSECLSSFPIFCQHFSLFKCFLELIGVVHPGCHCIIGQILWDVALTSYHNWVHRNACHFHCRESLYRKKISNETMLNSQEKWWNPRKLLT